jgi:hypothetical protein
MADVMNSLFGVSPESLQAQRDAALQAQAMKYAELDPFQRATSGIYAGANRLGGAIGGMLGAQDPEMMRLQQRQSMLQGLDLTNPESLKQGIQAAMQNKDYQLVSELTNRYEAANKNALNTRVQESIITKNTADQKAAATPAEIAKAQRIAAIKQAIPAYTAAGDTQTVTLLQNELDALTPAEKAINFGAEAERYAKDQFGKSFNNLTPEEARKVNKKLEELDLASKKAGKTDITLPGVAKAGDVTTLRKDLQAITKPYQDQADSAGDAIDLANMAIKSNNFAAVSSLSRSLAKAAGETQLSRNDVEAFGIDPSLVGSVSDTVSRLAQSRPTVDTLTKLRQLAEALKKKAESRISIEEQQLQETARVSGQFTEPQIDTVFRRRPKEGKTSFNSIAEAEAAKLPKGTIITINGRRARVE